MKGLFLRFSIVLITSSLRSSLILEDLMLYLELAPDDEDDACIGGTTFSGDEDNDVSDPSVEVTDEEVVQARITRNFPELKLPQVDFMPPAMPPSKSLRDNIARITDREVKGELTYNHKWKASDQLMQWYVVRFRYV